MKTSETYTKHCLRLYAGDYEMLAALRPDEKPNKLIRKLIREYIDTLKQEKENRNAAR